VPVRDEANSIHRLIEALLGQTHPPNEIVITDGGSVDGTREIIREIIGNVAAERKRSPRILKKTAMIGS